MELYDMMAPAGVTPNLMTSGYLMRMFSKRSDMVRSPFDETS